MACEHLGDSNTRAIGPNRKSQSIRYHFAGVLFGDDRNERVQLFDAGLEHSQSIKIKRTAANVGRPVVPVGLYCLRQQWSM